MLYFNCSVFISSQFSYMMADESLALIVVAGYSEELDDRGGDSQVTVC